MRGRASLDPRFKIVVMPDITDLGSNAAAVTQIIASVANGPAAYKLPDGRLVVSAFNASLNPASWWTLADQCLNARVSTRVRAHLLGWQSKAASFADLSYGFGDWGTATPQGARNMQGDPASAHGMAGRIYMMPVDPQQYRPKGPVLWEAGNSEAFRSAWMSAITGGSDWVQIVTWSDFSESSEIEPYTDATLATDIGTGYYDLNGYFAAWFLTGTRPAITHDVLYYFYRREPSNAMGAAQSPIRVINGTAEDDIELLAFLTAPGVLKIRIGGQDYSQSAPAGMSSFKVPSQPGIPLFSLNRGGSTVLSFQGGVEIHGAEGIPSGVLDMTYWSGSASQTGICAL